MSRRAAGAKPPSQTGGHKQKYRPGLDPLEQEANLGDMVPLGSAERARMLEVIQELQSRGNLLPGEVRALNMWKMNLNLEGLKGQVHQDFVRDFWGWLLGRGQESDHLKTPWYRQSLADDPEVTTYVDMFVHKLREFKLKIELLKIRRPIGINQCFIYYKYLIRGEPTTSENFLEDWKVFFEESEAAGKAPYEQNWRDDRDYSDDYEKRGIPMPHEVRPYGTARQTLANDRNKKHEAGTPARLIGNRAPRPPANGGNARRNMNQPGGAMASDSDDDSDDPQAQGPPTQNAAVISAIENMADRLEQALIQAQSQAAARQTPQAPPPIIVQPQGPDMAMLKLSQDQAAANAKVDVLQQQLAQLQQELAQERQSNVPSQETRSKIEQYEKQLEAMREAQNDYRKNMTDLLYRIDESRKDRAAETDSLLKAIEGVKLTAATGKTDIVISESPGQEKFRQDFSNFMAQFTAYKDEMLKRQGQIAERLENPFPPSTVVIEELDEMVGQLKSIEGAIKSSNDSMLAIQSAADAAAAAQKAESMALVARAEGQTGALQKFLADREKEQEANRIQFNKMLDQTFQRIFNGLAQQQLDQKAAIGQIIEKMPSSDPTLTLEWKSSTEETMHNLALSQASLADAAKVLAEQGTKTQTLLQNQQALLEKVAQESAKSTQLALISKEQENQLAALNEAAKNKFQEQERTNQFLGEKLRQAAEIHNNLKNEHYANLQRMQQMGQQLNFLAQQNQMAAQAFQQERAAHQQKLYQMSQMWFNHIRDLQQNLPRLSGPERDSLDVKPMDMDDDVSDEDDEEYTLEERMLLTGQPLPMLLTGPLEPPKPPPPPEKEEFREDVSGFMQKNTAKKQADAARTAEAQKKAEEYQKKRQEYEKQQADWEKHKARQARQDARYQQEVAELQRTDPETARLLKQVLDLEQSLIEQAEKGGLLIDLTTRHILGVRTTKKAVLNVKLDTYRQLIERWNRSS